MLRVHLNRSLSPIPTKPNKAIKRTAIFDKIAVLSLLFTIISKIIKCLNLLSAPSYAAFESSGEPDIKYLPIML